MFDVLIWIAIKIIYEIKKTFHIEREVQDNLTFNVAINVL